MLLKDSDLFFQSAKSRPTKDATQIIVLSAVFSFLTTVTIYSEWTSVKLSGSFLQNFIAIFAAVLSGMIIISCALMLLAFRKASRKDFSNSLFIIAYTSTPTLLLGWIPHGFAKLVGVVWSLLFIKVALEIGFNKTQKQSTLTAAGLAVALAALALITNTYLISPI